LVIRKPEIQISLRAMVDQLEVPQQQPARPATGAQPAAPAPAKAEQIPT
jgi:hypothetical protein